MGLLLGLVSRETGKWETSSSQPEHWVQCPLGCLQAQLLLTLWPRQPDWLSAAAFEAVAAQPPGGAEEVGAEVLVEETQGPRLREVPSSDSTPLDKHPGVSVEWAGEGAGVITHGVSGVVLGLRS